jgi:hypothetical protein
MLTGSALMDFLIGLVALGVAVAIAFLAIDRIGRDDFFKRIAKLAIGGLAAILLIAAVSAVFFGGGRAGLAITPVGLVNFAVGVIVVVVVLYVIDLFLGWAQLPFTDAISYVIGAIALIAILLVANQVLLGGGWGIGPRTSVNQPLTR